MSKDPPTGDEDNFPWYVSLWQILGGALWWCLFLVADASDDSIPMRQRLRSVAFLIGIALVLVLPLLAVILLLVRWIRG